MKITYALAAAPIVLILSAPVFADEPEKKDKQEAAQEQSESKAKDDDGEAIMVPEVKAEQKRICRRVKLDISSRRATRVCKTRDGWRDFNQRR